jgi:hypothetical protein
MTLQTVPSAVAITWTEKEAAAALRCSVGLLRKDRLGARTIPFFRLGRSVRYSPSRVLEALAAREEGGRLRAA